MRCAIFVDGACLDWILKDHFGRGAINYDQLAARLAGGVDVLRTYYYDAPPWQDSHPSPIEARRFAAKQSFFSSLRKLPKFEVREGKCQRTWDKNKNGWRFGQKRVDVLFSVDLVRLASKAQIGKAILVAGDSDFLPAVNVAKDEGVSISLCHSPDLKQVHRELWDAADERFPFDQSIFDAVRRAPAPAQVMIAGGRSAI